MKKKTSGEVWIASVSDNAVNEQEAKRRQWREMEFVSSWTFAAARFQRSHGDRRSGGPSP